MRKFLRLGAAVAGVCVVSFGPFIWMGQLSQARAALSFPPSVVALCFTPVSI